jgi:ABC-type nitrate/sulfonate/bicarbonate transport system substrate-binding protein
MNHRFRFITLALAVSFAMPALAADKIHVGKAIDDNWVYIPVDIAAEKGFYAKYGLEVEISQLSGGAKLQQALLAGSIDIGFGGAQAMALSVKGSPTIAVASFAGEPYNFSIVVAADSPIKTITDLKGKAIGFATNGSLPDWLAQRFAIAQGWGKDGMKRVTTGGAQASNAAVQSHQLDSMMTTTELGLFLESKKQGRIIVGMQDYAKHLVTQAIFAHVPFLNAHPDQVERYLKAYFATVAWMKSHKDETSEIAARTLHMDKAVMERTYDEELFMLPDDGSFDPIGIDMLRDSFVELGILDKKPTDDQILTRRFLPVKP